MRTYLPTYMFHIEVEFSWCFFFSSTSAPIYKCADCEAMHLLTVKLNKFVTLMNISEHEQLKHVYSVVQFFPFVFDAISMLLFNLIYNFRYWEILADECRLYVTLNVHYYVHAMAWDILGWCCYIIVFSWLLISILMTGQHRWIDQQ